MSEDVRKIVDEEMDRLESRLERRLNGISTKLSDIGSDVNSMRIKIAVLETKSAIWGGLAGAGVSLVITVVAAVVAYYLKARISP